MARFCLWLVLLLFFTAGRCDDAADSGAVAAAAEEERHIEPHDEAHEHGDDHDDHRLDTVSVISCREDSGGIRFQRVYSVLMPGRYVPVPM
jgi:hypothetical protein